MRLSDRVRLIPGTDDPVAEAEALSIECRTLELAAQAAEDRCERLELLMRADRHGYRLDMLVKHDKVERLLAELAAMRAAGK